MLMNTNQDLKHIFILQDNEKYPIDSGSKFNMEGSRQLLQASFPTYIKLPPSQYTLHTVAALTTQI